MKTIKKQKNKKLPLIIAASIPVLIALCVGTFLLYQSRHQTPHSTATQNHTGSTGTVNYGPPTPQEQQEGSSQKQEVIQKNTPSSPSTQTDNTINVSISRASQSSTGQPLNIFTVVTGISAGTCTVTLTQANQPTVSQTFTITTQATYATCQNVSIPATSFSTSGTWNLSITAQDGSRSSPAATTTVTINK